MKILYSLAIVSAMVGFTAPVLAQTTINITPTGDTYTESGAPTTNFSTAPILLVRQTDATTNLTRNTYLQFNLSSVPANSTITSAVLRLNGRHETTGAGVPISVYGGNNSALWDYNTLNYNNAFSMTGVNVDSATALATRTVAGGTAANYDWNVTAFINSRRSIGHATLALSTNTTHLYRTSFNSGQATTARPVLIITTSTAPRPVDPGTAAWQTVPAADVASVCKLDINSLRQVSGMFAVVRYGRYCYQSTDNGSGHQVYSVTKTLGAVLTGMAMYQTRNLPASSVRKMGPIGEFQPINHWVDNMGEIDSSATVAHVLTMRGYNANLPVGQRVHSYDSGGGREIDRLLTVIRGGINQDAARLGTTPAEFSQRFLFSKLGMTQSTWPGSTIGISWQSSLGDMARLGLLMLNGGVWNGERLLTPQYLYALSHPAIEDGTTGTQYGYLTWLSGPSCTPKAIWRRYPHGPISGATTCKLPSCQQRYDVGVFYAGGLGGQFIFVHRGLDLVIVGKNWGEGRVDLLWEAIRPAIVNADPTYRNNQAAFCPAYEAGDYAPDLKLWEGENSVTGFQ